MTLPKINPLKTKSWGDLKNHFDEIKSYTISYFFDNDSDRFESFSIKFGDLLVDYSKNRINDKTLEIFDNIPGSSVMPIRILANLPSRDNFLFRMPA